MATGARIVEANATFQVKRFGPLRVASRRQVRLYNPAARRRTLRRASAMTVRSGSAGRADAPVRALALQLLAVTATLWLRETVELYRLMAAQTGKVTVEFVDAWTDDPVMGHLPWRPPIQPRRQWSRSWRLQQTLS